MSSRAKPKKQTRQSPTTAPVEYSTYLSRAGRAGRCDLGARAPELRPLADMTVSVFGLGCLGAPSAMEFARAGVGSLRILDSDFVDAGTVLRWPRGLAVVGNQKTQVIYDWIRSEYPYCDVHRWNRRIGAVTEFPGQLEPEGQVVADVTRNVGLIYDATAELGMHTYLADCARRLGVPYIGVSGTPGGWGGRVFRLRPGAGTGCFWCYMKRCLDKEIDEPPKDPRGTAQPVGCADPTFLASGFDMLEIAIMGVRVAVSTLCEGHEDSYPKMDWDITHISIRNKDGQLVPPTYKTYPLHTHPECPICNPK